MKHLKRYNEEINSAEAYKIEKSFLVAKFTPPTEKVRLSNLYSALFIEVDKEIENEDGEMGRYLVIDVDYSCYMTVHAHLDYALQDLLSNKEDVPDYSSWQQLLNDETNAIGKVVNLLEYNDTNFQEIENILLDYNINVDNVWAILK